MRIPILVTLILVVAAGLTSVIEARAQASGLSDEMRAALLNHTYLINHRPYLFKNGLASGSADQVSISILEDWTQAGDLDGDAVPDAAAVLVMNTASSGIFHYLAMVYNVTDPASQTFTGQIGELVKIKHMALQEKQVYLELGYYAREDHLCCPTLEAARSYEVEHGQVVCVASNSLAIAPAALNFASPPPYGEASRWIELAQPKKRNTPPLMNSYPECLRVTLGEDGTAGSFLPHESQLRVYAVSDYEALFNAEELKLFKEQLATIKSAIKTGNGKGGKAIPVLPAIKEARAAQSHYQTVSFSGGKGIRFLAPSPEDSMGSAVRELLYVFQGLTDDGAYLVSFTGPLTFDAAAIRGGEAMAFKSSAEIGSLSEEVLNPPPATLDAWLTSLKIPQP